MKILMIKNICVSKKNNMLLKNINLTFETNKVYGIIGDNGVGKTTLFKVLLGLIKYRGSIYLDHSKINGDNLKGYLKQIGFVMPFPDAYDNFTIREVMEEHLFYMNYTLNKPLNAYLLDFGLKVSSETKIKELSLGMKQKLNIALALSHNPSILILDEPFNGLDRSGVRVLKQLIIDFKQKDKVVLLSSHSLHDLENVIDEVIVFDYGKVITTTSISALKKKGVHSLEEYDTLLREGALYGN